MYLQMYNLILSERVGDWVNGAEEKKSGWMGPKRKPNEAVYRNLFVYPFLIFLPSKDDRNIFQLNQRRPTKSSLLIRGIGKSL